MIFLLLDSEINSLFFLISSKKAQMLGQFLAGLLKNLQTVTSVIFWLIKINIRLNNKPVFICSYQKTYDVDFFQDNVPNKCGARLLIWRLVERGFFSLGGGMQSLAALVDVVMLSSQRWHALQNVCFITIVRWYPL